MYFALNNHQELICHLIKCPSPNSLVPKQPTPKRPSQRTEGMELPNQECIKIRTFGEKENNKSLEILEAKMQRLKIITIKQAEIKKEKKKEENERKK